MNVLVASRAIEEVDIIDIVAARQELQKLKNTTSEKKVGYYLGAIVTITSALVKSSGAILIFMSDDLQVERLLCRR